MNWDSNPGPNDSAAFVEAQDSPDDANAVMSNDEAEAIMVGGAVGEWQADT
jgi:hypothetical protein